MPELPEVETVRQGLLGLVGKRILSIELNRSDLRFPSPEDMDSIAGRKIVDIDRRAKYLLIRLENDLTWLTHLGMTGRFGRTLEGKHDHVVIDFVDGTRLVYTDPRRFGIMDLIHDGSEHKLLNHLGPEPLGDAWSGSQLHSSLRGRNVSIKSALLDQKIVVGIGNIYACEILYDAKISPFIPGNQLDIQKISRLIRSMKKILQKAISSGGTTIKNYASIDGTLGNFQNNFKVYNKKDKKISKFKIKCIKQSGRSTFFCPALQKSKYNPIS